MYAAAEFTGGDCILTMKRMEAMTLSLFLWAAFLSPTFLLGARAENTGASVAAGNSKTVQAMFLNVGKADAALFCLGDQRYLIDTGTKESADAMLRALNYFGVTKLDGVIITHIDSDHIGGLKSLLKSDIRVNRLYAATFNNAKSIEKHPVTKQADKYAIPLTWLNSGDVIIANDVMRFVTLGPLTHDMVNENNNSLVFRLETPEGTMLLTGDMEVEEETALLAAGLIQKTDVLKVGHHGDDDASSDSFIYTAKPQIAVISTDSSVEQDTPDPKVISRLWNIGAEVLVTQKAACCILVTLSGGNAVGQAVDYRVV